MPTISIHFEITKNGSFALFHSKKFNGSPKTHKEKFR